ncbi:MAG TPA: hypothetical protein ENJ51_05860 [Leucothrix mucor]|uniref:Transposase n=1 Tax=Leucothrix mucor TaxID=45248 RepID=A0A7V2SZE7_LEUMU|nr:hypothetical protein [Leucothrix mucor]
MPRLARTVFADIPHHITQRGNRREDVFFNDERKVSILRRNIEKGLPCGSDEFIENLEALAERTLKYRPYGRPTKN